MPSTQPGSTGFQFHCRPQPSRMNGSQLSSQAKALTGVAQQLPTRCRGVSRLVGADCEFSQEAKVSPETSWDRQ